MSGTNKRKPLAASDIGLDYGKPPPHRPERMFVLRSIVFIARRDDFHIAPSVSAGTVDWPNRPRADAWGYWPPRKYGQSNNVCGSPLCDTCRRALTLTAGWGRFIRVPA